ncbi:hypothetical protein JKY72_05480, partial [Candidatus Gracilibacteria bacterium]|nr:hypothetical protein [Candidatus Gracilibacteria bacterium]
MADDCGNDHSGFVDSKGNKLVDVVDGRRLWEKGDVVKVGSKTLQYGRFMTYSYERSVRQLFDNIRYALGNVHCMGKEFTGRMSVTPFTNPRKGGTYVLVTADSLQCAGRGPNRG